MSIIVEFTLLADSFALARTLREAPDVSVDCERLATHSREWVMPFLWVRGVDADRFEGLLESDPSVYEARALDESDGVTLFNVHWNDDVQQLVDDVVDQHGTVLEAQASGEQWFFKIRFVDRDELDNFHAYFEERDVPFEVKRLQETKAPMHREFDLTAEQRETLVAALELGYFEVPRRTQIAELADELGVSTNAVSQRLRRASGNLVRNALTVESADVDGSS